MDSQAEPGNQRIAVKIIRSFWGGDRGGLFAKNPSPVSFTSLLPYLLCNQLGEVHHFKFFGFAHHVAGILEHGNAVWA